MHRHFSFNGTQLKLIALCFMLFDHLKIYLLNNVLPSWTAWIARFVAPLFVYMLVEGFFKLQVASVILFVLVRQR